MGQKVNPIGYRLAVNRDWRSRWYASPKDFPDFLHADLQIRNYVKKKLALAAVSKVVIERAWDSLRVTIYTARPVIVIGRKSSEIEKMTDEIEIKPKRQAKKSPAKKKSAKPAAKKQAPTPAPEAPAPAAAEQATTQE